MLCLLSSCGKERTDAGYPLPEGKYPVALSASIDEATRATVDGSWSGGESVAIQAISQGGVSWDSAETKLFTAESSGNLTLQSGYSQFWWKSTSETKKIRAWHLADGSTSAEVPTKWSVNSNQSKDANYQASDLLFAYGTVPFGKTASLQFRHQTARVIVNIKKGTNISGISYVLIGSSDIIQNGTFRIGDSSSLTWSPGTNKTTITPHKAASTTSGYDATYEALLIPQPTAGKKMITVQTTDYAYSHEYTAPSGAAALQSGEVRTYNITVTDDGLVVNVSSVNINSSYSGLYVTATQTNGVQGSYNNQRFKLDLSGIAEGAYKTFKITYQDGAKP